MLRRSILLFAFTCACSANNDDGTTKPSTYDRTLPPPRPTSANVAGITRWFAVNQVQIGVTKRGTGVKDVNAWMELGFDLDARYTTADDSINSVNSCKRKPGSLTKFLQDGPGGVDNNFGQHVLAAVQSVKPDAEPFVNDGIVSGRYTILLRLDDVGDGDDSSVPGAIYLAGDFGGGTTKPTFSTADKWPINPLSLSDGKTVTQPKVTFPKGYVRASTWVSGGLGDQTVDLGPVLSGSDVSLPIESAVVAVNLDGSNGTIAGAVRTSSIETGLAPVAARLGLCPSDPTYQDVVKTLSLAADLVAGAPQLQDTTVECNAISIGYGFTMKPTGVPDSLMAAATEPAPDTCAK